MWHLQLKNLICISTILLLGISCASQKANGTFVNGKYKIDSSCKTYFDNCGVQGAVVIFDKNNGEWILSDTLGVKTESLPASTFKIINLLIALETKTIQDEHEVVKWVGQTDTVKYGYRPEIYHDMSVKEAFEVSAGWVFIELAKKIGRSQYKKYLSACQYGNLDLTTPGDDFWNFGNFAISPIGQVRFLKNLYEGKLPFSKQNIEIVKRVMVTEKTNGYTIHAKAGWTRANHTNTGWWVGYVEANNNTYFFVTRLLQDRKNNRDDFGACRKEITKRILYDRGFIKEGGAKAEIGKSLYKAIDHVPVVVNDLEKVKDVFKNQLYFSVKEGKEHSGIKNCFVKFQDGTYLEFVTPLDSAQAIGKYYTDFLKKREGGTSLAISITSADWVKQILSQKNIQFTADSNKIWQTIEPASANLFFIAYANSNWKETPANITHPNTATALQAVCCLADNIDEAAKSYINLGFAEAENGKYAETPYRLFTIGQSHLYLLDGKKANNINRLLNGENLQGVCGFAIKVRSLRAFNQLIPQNANVRYEANQTTVYSKSYHFFITFSE
jgi:beta-lactamase class D